VYIPLNTGILRITSSKDSRILLPKTFRNNAYNKYEDYCRDEAKTRYMITEDFIVERFKQAVNEFKKPPYYKKGDNRRD